jgi:DNA-binding CsgD family transcriptional regulator
MSDKQSKLCLPDVWRGCLAPEGKYEGAAVMVMSELTESRLDGLAGRFREAARFSDGWEEAVSGVLSDMAGLLGANTAAIVVADAETGASTEFLMGGRLDWKWISLYNDQYGAVDPTTQIVKSLPVGQVDQCHRYIDASFVDNSAYYREFLIPAGGRFSSGARLFDDGREWGRLGLQTNAAQGPLEGRSLDALAYLTPHIQKAVQEHRFTRLARRQGLMSGMLEALDQMGCGGLIVEGNGQVVAMNPMAELQMNPKAELPRRPSVALVHGRLSALDGEARSVLRRLIAEAAKMLPHDWRERSAALPREEGRPVVARVSPFFDPAEADSRSFCGQCSLVLVKLIDPDARRTLAEACLREAFSLTIAEARLAAAIAGGQDLAAVAERIGVAIGTARGQIKRIFSKTETSGQPELAALLERFVVVEGR